MLREISEVESIGDSCYNMACTINQKVQGKKEHFTEEQYMHLHAMMDITNQALTQMNLLIKGRKANFDVYKCYNIETEINNYRDQLKSQNIIDVNNHTYTYAIGTIYMDLINSCEKLGDYVVNVVEARTGTRMNA
jgi:phosphate:Na+ symporter